MEENNLSEIFTTEFLNELLPPAKSDQSFEALYGDPEEGSYDIELQFDKIQDSILQLYFELTQRPGKCMPCNLTYGLPLVFSRHPLINLSGIVERIGSNLPDCSCVNWELGRTVEISRERHIIPFYIYLENK